MISIAYELPNKLSENEKLEANEGQRWTNLPKSGEKIEGICYRTIGRKFKIDLSEFNDVIASKDNDRLFILKSSKPDLAICIMTPSTEEREVWLTALSSVFSQSPKPISSRAANDLLQCLNNIVDREGAKEYQIFRTNGNAWETSDLYRYLALSMNREDNKKKYKNIPIHSLSSTAKRIVERFSESLLTSELYPEFDQIFANSSYVNTQSKHLRLSLSKVPDADEASKLTLEKKTSETIARSKLDERKAAIPILKKLLCRLPPMNYALIKRIVQVCALICKCKESGMDANNLSVVIGTTLLLKSDPAHLKKLRSTMVPILETLISNSGEFFGDDQVELFDETKSSMEKGLPFLEDEKILLDNIIEMYNVESLDAISWPTMSKQLKWAENSPQLMKWAENTDSIENNSALTCCNIL